MAVCVVYCGQFTDTEHASSLIPRDYRMCLAIYRRLDLRVISQRLQLFEMVHSLGVERVLVEGSAPLS